MKKICFLLLSIVFFACENNQEIGVDQDNLLLGTWVEPLYDNESITFKRAAILPTEAYAIEFKKDGTFIEKTAGWCGTPPLTFSNYIGTFQIDETLIKITTTTFPLNYQWRIISLTENELLVKRELTDQEIAHRNLMDLFDEIQNLAYSNSCVNASDWSFVAYGSKACGGAQGYIAYSTNIDTVAFLNKVEVYTEAEKAYNIKWGIISDCSLVAPPIAVECQNGYPTLIY
jgi:hypothetical protein